MQAKAKTMIVTGASEGIGAGVTKAFLERGYNVVANSPYITKSELEPAKQLALVDGNVADASTTERIVAVAKSEFGSIDAVWLTPVSSSWNHLRSTRRTTLNSGRRRIF